MTSIHMPCATEEASTPRGFVCNSPRNPWPMTPSSLQPHEGSSVTCSEHRAWQCSHRLQPHEGSSVTPDSSTSTSAGSVLQPHEGSSVTRADRRDGSRRPASTPRGFVCNSAFTSVLIASITLQPHEGSSVTRRRCVQIGFDRLASTPRGFVCNPVVAPGLPKLKQLQPHEGSSVTIARISSVVSTIASTPRGFVCNPGPRRRRCRPLLASTPRGFVCNRPTVRLTPCRRGSFNPTRVRL